MVLSQHVLGVLTYCKLSRCCHFTSRKSCEVIRDHKTKESLQYAFIEFEKQEDCESAYFKMDNVLIDDRRIHVDFSQSVSKYKWKGKGRGVEIMDEQKDSFAANYRIKDNTRKDKKYDLVYEDEAVDNGPGEKKKKKKKHKERKDSGSEDESRKSSKHKKHKHKKSRSRSRERKRHRSRSPSPKVRSRRSRSRSQDRHTKDRYRSSDYDRER